MLERLYQHRTCIQQMEEEGMSHNMPIVEISHWRLLKEVLDVLAPFKHTTKVWEMEPTMTTVGEELYTLQQKLQDFCRDKLSEFIREPEEQEGIGLRFARGLLKSLEERFPQLGMSTDLPAWGNLLNPRLKVISKQVINN